MHRNNCFDIVRLFAAYMVIYSHHHTFMSLPDHVFRGLLTLGGLSVAIFFSVSGFLVTQSFQRTPNYIGFMTKRVKRIFPALIVCSFLMIYIIAPFYQKDAINYIFSSDAFSYFMRISMMLPVNVPDVFAGYKFEGPINGSLWTLSMEFACYLVLGFMLCLSNTWKTPAIFLIILISLNILLNKEAMDAIWYSISVGWMLKFGICFFFGSLLSMTIDKWNEKKIKTTLLIISICILYIMKGTTEITTLGYMAITFITLAIGVSFKDSMIGGKFDISYGAYIYAWPVQQIIANQTSLSLYPSMIASLCITSLLAWASWNFVEKPFIKAKKVNIDDTSLTPVM
ncbi:acyltransferase family protein [Pantoea phytobeneficialis]|uniref:Acyltransferase n=1 Tax=Pantoea phytobeneficialis TaxID=2052056 RepID=A0AAP9H5M0_9GAMM|nr:acyltransferase [Pantoea phytobeneficialis]MDO6405346.1 acyltransferase [Pantoea phytobeneficialis]QGR06998.1 acyltransferase [Pantoea phytobeneficialis]